MITETIFSGVKYVIPMDEVSHVEKCETKHNEGALIIVFKYSRWNEEGQELQPNVYLHKAEAKKFMRSWCHYRWELGGGEVE